MDDSDPDESIARDEGRRRVLGIFSKSLLGLMAAGALAGPAAMVFDPIIGRDTEEESTEWFNVGTVASFKVGASPRKIVLRRDRRDAWLHEKNVPIGSVLVQRMHEKGFRVFSAVCPHLGCAVKPQGSKGFLCPCHNSAFRLDGSRTTMLEGSSNPSPRDLDSLEWRETKGELQVLWTEFDVGIPEKRAKA